MSDQPNDIQAVFEAALQKETPDERAAYLDEVCRNDAEARARVEALLEAHDEAGSFLERPAAQFVPPAATVDAGTHGADMVDDGGSILEFLLPTEKPDCLGTIGEYEITEVIGRGGMGLVLKGFDPKLGRIVAVKVLAPELASNASARKRFLREGRAAAAVSHDHVVTIYGIDDSGTLPLIAMEYISGASLEDRIKRDGPLELTEILRIGMQIASGMAAAHAQGLVHRDVKPANILLENGVEKVKITDFGLARAVDDVRMTKPGVVTGTPEYMSPEQARGESVEHRSDLFSLGSVLYAMCTGRSPFRAENTVAMIRRVCEDTPRPIQEVNPQVPDWLVQIINELLEKSPQDRFQSASELAELLSRCLAHVQQPSANSLPDRLTRRRRDQVVRRRSTTRRRAWLALAAIVLLVALGGFSLTEAAGVTDLAGTVIRIVRGDGTLVIEIDDPDVGVSVDGKQLVITGAGSQVIRLGVGRHNVEAVKDGEAVYAESITITRGGRQIVRVSQEASGLLEPSTQYGYIDLQVKANHHLAGAFHGYPDNTLEALPEGEQVIGGVKFKIGPHLIALNPEHERTEVEGIPVGRSFRVLYILHGTGYGEGGTFVEEGTAIGEYRLHYDDGSMETIPIVYGEDVRDWWEWGWATREGQVIDVRGQESPDRLRLVWRGSNGMGARFNKTNQLRLYLSVWENPHPDERCVSIDYVATHEKAAPICVAMSVTDAVESLQLLPTESLAAASGPGETPRPNRPFYFTPHYVIADKKEKINLDGVQLTDADLVHLRGLTGLKELDLSGTPVTDAGLEHLHGLATLEKLFLADTQVTDAGISQLKSALPDCEILLERDNSRRRFGRFGERRPTQRLDRGQIIDRLFKLNDANGDGQISSDEARPMVKSNFQGFDTNGDGVVDRAEFDEHAPKHFGRPSRPANASQ